MVDVADEPLFPLSHRPQPAMGTSGAFFLQRFPIVRITTFPSLHIRVRDFTSSRIHNERMLPQIYTQYVTLFDKRRLWYPINKHDIRTMTIRVQYEFRRIQAAFRIPTIKPFWNIGQ